MSKLHTHSRSTGAIGEKLALQYLLERGYSLVQTNYWKKWGEIDLIVRKDQIVHFVEVKAVTYETKSDLVHAVTHETWRPEELVHKTKLHQIEKALETWLSEQNYEGEWQIDVAAIRMVPRETFATVNLIENVIIE